MLTNHHLTRLDRTVRETDTAAGSLVDISNNYVIHTLNRTVRDTDTAAKNIFISLFNIVHTNTV